MAYSNAIFYINLGVGSDAARTALTSCVASNPSGTTVRINKTGHGLVTGAIVDLTLFDAYLNDAWKITVVDADNFDLDTAVWSITTVDNNGTVTPRGGSSWTDGWLTISSGPTAARTQLGDTIRISKTGDPVSLGNATWTNLSKTVTLATAQTTTIEQGDSAYTTANAGTTTSSTTRKQGSTSRAVYKTTSGTANTLYGYRNLGTTLNLSSYDAITLWVQYYGSTSFSWRICLCSDTAGVNIVDDFIIPQVGATSTSSPIFMFPVVLTRVGGGNLGSSIQSVAIYTGSGTPTVSSGLWFDNISACSSTGLNLTSLISKNSSAFGGSEVWYPIQSIDGTTVLLDGHAQTTATGGRGYYGASETVTTYFRNLFRTNPSGTSTTLVNTINEGGTVQYPITYSGGWNTSTNLQDGETIYDGGNGYGYGVHISSREYLIFERISAVRYYDGFYLTNSPNNQLSIPNLIGNSDSGYVGAGRGVVDITNAVSNNVGVSPGASSKITVIRAEGNISSGISLGTGDYNVYLSASNVNNNGSYAVDASSGDNCNITLGTASDNGTAAIRNSSGNVYLYNSTLNGTEFTGATTAYNSRVFSTNHDLSGYAYIYTDGGTIDQRASTFTGGSGAEWRLNVNSSTRNDYYPLKLPVAQYAVASGSLLIVSASMKKSHATDVRGRLVIPGGQLLGVPNDVVATLADNTNEQGLTVSCTPTMSGVLGVEVWAEYVNNTGTVSVDTVTARV